MGITLAIVRIALVVAVAVAVVQTLRLRIAKQDLRSAKLGLRKNVLSIQHMQTIQLRNELWRQIEDMGLAQEQYFVTHCGETDRLLEELAQAFIDGAVDDAANLLATLGTFITAVYIAVQNESRKQFVTS
ncbi:MAG TPA: hypothetical protein VLE99_04115 [Candidatus Saccharimonadales bacterium]|nr:hypothetical protein [Candidatus Saccharimonadales bacterium]